MDLSVFGRILLVVAAVLFLMGLLLIGLSKLGLGHLPGDIVSRRDGVTIYFPIVTMILVSIILTILLNLLFWFLGRGR
ncbi:MAG: DUF2905 domain-containing protein [Armatimonadota bacterium]